MTIGELLKEYRIEQQKSQSNFAGQAVSQSFYSKVEKNLSQISAQDLFNLLQQNDISVQDFWGKLEQTNNNYHGQVMEIDNLMIKAYYQNNLAEMKKIKILVNQSQLPSKEKEEKKLLVVGFVEIMKNSKKVDKQLRSKIKEKIFNIPNFNQNKLMLYCDFMRFYDLDDNELISKNILRQYINTADINIQELLLAIIGNLLIFSIEKNRLAETDYFLKMAGQISTRPELLFYKADLYFLANLISFKKSKDKSAIENCRMIIKLFVSVGLKEYSKELSKFLDKQLGTEI